MTDLTQSSSTPSSATQFTAAFEAGQVIHLPDLAATLALGEQLGRSLPPGSILLLQGDLGSGKTSLVQGIGRGLGIADPILSPTFTLINEYYDGRMPLYHLDLYRLEPAEVDSLYLEAYWDGEEFPPGLVAIEWAERLSVKPLHYWELALAIAPTTGRQAILSQVGASPADKAIVSIPGGRE